MRLDGIDEVELRIDDLQPYIGMPGIDNYRPGQAEAIIRTIKELKNYRIIEISAPTAAGKTLILNAVGNVLSSLIGTKVTYTTPSRTLAYQIRSMGMLNNKRLPIPILTGKGNYNCAYEPSVMADSCAYRGKEAKCPAFTECSYWKAKEEFFASDFGVCTLSYALSNFQVKKKRPLLLIDESDTLEDGLLEKATVQLPAGLVRGHEVDYEALIGWVSRLNRLKAETEDELERIRQTLESLKEKDDKRAILRELREVSDDLNKIDRSLQKAGIIKMYLDKKEGYFIDGLVFKPLEARLYFDHWTRNNSIVLASGTPMTRLLCKGYGTVSMPHPIPVDRRTVIFDGIAKMTRKAVTPEGMRAIARRIVELHETKAKGRHTLVHCHSEERAKEIYKIIKDIGDERAMLYLPGDQNSYSITKWKMEHDKILLSFGAAARGLDLKGPEFPLNVIIKVPYPDLGDKWTKARLDSLESRQRWYSLKTATTLMQMAGRTTRDITDFSWTYILDSDFYNLYFSNEDLFLPWFRDSLFNTRGQPISREAREEAKVERQRMKLAKLARILSCDPCRVSSLLR